MKTRFACLILCTLVITQLAAQRPNGLYVHSVKGQVLYCPQAGHVWQSATSRQPVSRLDSMQINANSEVVLIDGTNDNVYKCSTPMRSNILHVIRVAREQANSLLESVAQQLKNNALGKGANAKQIVVAGVTTRAEEEDRIHDSIACLALQTGKLFLAKQQIYDKALKWRMVENEGLVHFVIENGSRDAYCVNILSVDKTTQKVSLCIVPSPDVDVMALVVPAGETLDLSMYRFLSNSSQEYTLLATKTAYVPSAVQNILRYPEDLPCK